MQKPPRSHPNNTRSERSNYVVVEAAVWPINLLQLRGISARWSVYSLLASTFVTVTNVPEAGDSGMLNGTSSFPIRIHRSRRVLWGFDLLPVNLIYYGSVASVKPTWPPNAVLTNLINVWLLAKSDHATIIFCNSLRDDDEWFILCNRCPEFQILLMKNWPLTAHGKLINL